MNKAQQAAMSRIHDNTLLKSVVADGEKSLWNYAEELFPGWIQVLDIIHVRDKLWLPAHLYCKKESLDAKEYVRDRLVALLTGEVDLIIEDFRIATEDGSLSATRTFSTRPWGTRPRTRSTRVLVPKAEDRLPSRQKRGVLSPLTKVLLGS